MTTPFTLLESKGVAILRRSVPRIMFAVRFRSAFISIFLTQTELIGDLRLIEI